MADYGNKNSDKRAEWYRDVVGPICNAARAAGLPACGISASVWKAEPAAGVAGSKLASGQWPTTLRDRAKKLAEQYGMTFQVNSTLANLTNARAFVAEMQLEAAWSGGGEAEGGGGDAGGAGGGGTEDLYSSPDLWAPDGGALNGTEGASAAGPGPWLWIGLGTAALAGGVVWWLRTRQAPALGAAAWMPRGYEPSDGYAPSAGLYHAPSAGLYPWTP